MTNRSAKPHRKPVASPRPRSKLLPAQRAGRDDPPEPKLSRAPAPARAAVMRLAAEVDALAAQLEASRARISELEARIDIDPLTDILNRRGFERELKRSLAYVKRYGTSVALVYVDLDGFKPVNDRHGHAAGDAVLKAIAAALVRNVRASDVVARIGGDEFAVLLWNVNAAGRRGQGRGARSRRLCDAGALGQRDACRRRLGGPCASRRARQPGRRAGARRRRDVRAQGRSGRWPACCGALTR